MLRLNLVNYLFQTVPMNFRNKEAFEALERNVAKRKIKALVRPAKLVETFKKGSDDEVFNNLGNYLLQPNVRLNKDLINPYTKQGESKRLYQNTHYAANEYARISVVLVF